MISDHVFHSIHTYLLLAVVFVFCASAPSLMAGMTGRHDVGGIVDDAPIDVESGTKRYQIWELQTHCLVTLISKKGLLTVDEV